MNLNKRRINLGNNQLFETVDGVTEHDPEAEVVSNWTYTKFDQMSLIYILSIDSIKYFPN